MTDTPHGPKKRLLDRRQQRFAGGHARATDKKLPFAADRQRRA